MQIASVVGVSTPAVPFAKAQPDQVLALGTRIIGVSPDYSTTAGVCNPGGAGLLYVKAEDTFDTGRLVHVSKDWVISDVPDTAATGRPFFVCVSSFTATNAYGWVAYSGIVPIQASAASSAAALYIGAAGQCKSAQVNGKQLVGAFGLIATTGSFTQTVVTRTGSYQIKCESLAGVFVGQTVSGTGIQSSTEISDIDLGGKIITVNNACTASGSVTGTFTNTGFVVSHIESPFVQGQVA